MWTSTYYGFYEYWELRHKVTFDGVNRLILVNEGVTELDAQIDLYSDWKEWTRLRDNLKYEPAFSTVGGEPTIEGQKLDVTYFLINGWKIKPYSGQYTLNIVGNLFDVDGGEIKVPADINPLFPNNITINTQTSVIVRQLNPQIDFNPTIEVSGSGLNSDESSTLTSIEGSVNDLTGSFTGFSQEINNISSSIIDINDDIITVNQELSTINGTLFEISGSIVEVRNILQQPVTASLVSSQLAILQEIQGKVDELHRLKGLQPANPLTVTRTKRIAGDIDQDITYVSASNTTTIQRV